MTDGATAPPEQDGDAVVVRDVEKRYRRTDDIAVIALVVGAVAELYPAWRAARVDPIEALRYE